MADGVDGLWWRFFVVGLVADCVVAKGFQLVVDWPRGYFVICTKAVTTRT